MKTRLFGSEHAIMHTDIKLWCISETNIMLSINATAITKKKDPCKKDGIPI